MRRDVYQGIADPTRRKILNMISHRSLNVNAVSENFKVSRTAVYKHIKILTECGLIVLKQKGRERYCEAKLERLSEVSHWVDQYKAFWIQRFDILDNYLHALQANNGKRRPAAVKKRKGKS